MSISQKFSVLIERLNRYNQFHPRAMKLIDKEKDFIVVAEDEPYFIEVYELIRENEKRKGRWGEVDENKFQQKRLSSPCKRHSMTYCVECFPVVLIKMHE